MSTSSTLTVQRPNPPARRAPGLAGLIRRHPVAAFLTWSFSVGQLLAFTPLVVDTGLPRQLFVVAITLIGLLLPAVVITRIVDGPDGVRALWQGAVRGRVPWGWYALALVGVPVVATAVAAAFLAWFFTVGQILAFTPVVFDTGVPPQVFVNGSTLIGLLLPAVVITRIVDGPAGVRALWRRAVHVRVGLGWYALALLAMPLLAVFIAVAILGGPVGLSPSVLASAFAANLLLPLVVTFVVNNWWEEVAWMGFVQARLQARRGPLRAAVLTAPLFALQHVSLTAGNPPVVMVLMMLVLIVLSVPFRIFNGWVYNRTASLFVVGLAHGASNAVSGGSGFQDGFLARLYPDEPVAVMSHQLAFVVLGLIVLVATRGRLGAARTTTDPSAITR